MATQNIYRANLGGVDGYSIADHSDFKPTGNFTVGTWFKTTADGWLFQSASAPASYAGWWLYISGGKVLFGSHRDTGTTIGTDRQYITGGTTVTDGNWHYAVATWDGSYLNLYLDGIKDATSVSWANAVGYEATNYIRIGCRNDTGTNYSFFSGSLDGTFIVNGTAWTQAQVATYMFQDITGATNLKAYYKFENNANDSSGNSHTLTSIGSPNYYNRTVYLTSGTSWIVPSDWNSSANLIETIGAGGTGGGNGRAGGGGGAYSNKANVTLTPGNSVTYQIGAEGAWQANGDQPAGHNTWFNGTVLADSTVGARGGADGGDPTGGAGGDTASGIGDVKYKGGTGGNSGGATNYPGGGGGGAGGRNGDGNNGTAGSGSTGGDGGTGSAGTGGASGTHGSPGSAGGAGLDIDGVVGSGGGGGGGNSTQDGGNGGLYGAGGGGGSLTKTGGTGRVGLIIIRYVSTSSGDLPFTYHLDPTKDNLSSADLELSNSDYLTITDGSQTGLDVTSEVSIECWIKLEGTGRQSIIAKGLPTDGGSNHGYILAYRGDVANDPIAFYLDGATNNGLLTVTADTSASLEDGAWHHIAVTSTTTTTIIYIDGNASTTSGGSHTDSGSLANASTFIIGADSNGNYYDGKIDSVRIFSDIRTADEIRVDRITKNVSDANLVSEWDFEGDYLDNTASNNDLTANGSPVFSPDSAFDINDRRSMVTNGSSTALSVLDHSDLKPTGNFTAGLWVKTTSNADQNLFQSYNNVSSVLAGFRIAIINSPTAGAIGFTSAKNTGAVEGTDYKTLSGTKIIADGAWHFIVCTWDGSKMYIYIDGVEDANVSWANAPAYNTTNYVRVGVRTQNATNALWYAGNTDGVFLVNGTAWDSTKINSYMAGQILTSETNLKLLLNLNGNFNDSTLNCHNATLISTPTFSHITPLIPGESPSPSLSPSASPSFSPSASVSLSPSRSVSLSPSLSPSASVSLSPSVSESRSPSLSPSPSSSISASPSLSESRSPSLSISPSPSAGFTDYSRTASATLPTTTNDLATAYSAQDVIDVSTDDGTRVAQSATAQYAIHQYKNFALASPNEAFIIWNGQTNVDPATSPVVLEIYNYNTASWEIINQCPVTYGQTFASYSKAERYYVSPGADVDFNLNTSITDLTNYKASNNTIACRIYQLDV